MKKIGLLTATLLLPLSAQEIKTADAVTGPWSKAITLPAEALPYYRITLGTNATGWIDELKADIGTRVKKGDILATIRAPHLAAAAAAREEEARSANELIQQTTAAAEASEATAAAEISEFTRISALAKSGSITTKARDEAQARLAAARAAVTVAQANIAAAKAEHAAALARAEEAKAELAFTTIAAPFDALVVARHAELGSFLGADSSRANCFTLEQTTPLRVRLHIPENAAYHAQAGDSAIITIAGQKITSALTRVSGSLDPTTKTMTAEIDLPTAQILPGSMGQATITLASLEKAIRVPVAALFTAPDGSRFVKVQAAGKSTDTPVKVAAIDEKTAILSQGPAQGEKVIVP